MVFLSIGPLGTNFSEILKQNTKFRNHQNASEYIVCEMAAILSWGRWIKPDQWLVPAADTYVYFPINI